MSLVALNRQGGETVYSQISRLLEDEIRTLFKPGDCLPSESELADRFAVNRHTIRRAIEELITTGLVERRHGKGTFVLDGPIDYSLGQATNFTEALESSGKAASSRLLRKLLIPARGGVAQRLGLEEDATVIWFETLRMADGHPVCLISHFLPAHLFPGLFNEYHGGALHPLLRQMGIQIRRQESLVSAILPKGDDASLLGMPINQPVLRVKSVNTNIADGMPIEYALTRFRADRIQLRINP